MSITIVKQGYYKLADGLGSSSYGLEVKTKNLDSTLWNTVVSPLDKRKSKGPNDPLSDTCTSVDASL